MNKHVCITLDTPFPAVQKDKLKEPAIAIAGKSDSTHLATHHRNHRQVAVCFHSGTCSVFHLPHGLKLLPFQTRANLSRLQCCFNFQHTCMFDPAGCNGTSSDSPHPRGPSHPSSWCICLDVRTLTSCQLVGFPYEKTKS